MRSKTKSNVFASDSSKRCDVDLKCLFGASGSALIGWGLGHKIRCLVFRSSLGLLFIGGLGPPEKCTVTLT